ncbi:unnamed protein product [Prorocentrum cordatum]|nr:unnamed protein product [Polarella glacialis]
MTHSASVKTQGSTAGSPRVQKGVTRLSNQDSVSSHLLAELRSAWGELGSRSPRGAPGGGDGDHPRERKRTLKGVFFHQFGDHSGDHEGQVVIKTDSEVRRHINLEPVRGVAQALVGALLCFAGDRRPPMEVGLDSRLHWIASMRVPAKATLVDWMGPRLSWRAYLVGPGLAGDFQAASGGWRHDDKGVNADLLMECLRRGRGRLQFFEHLDEEMRGMGEDEWEQVDGDDGEEEVGEVEKDYWCDHTIEPTEEQDKGKKHKGDNNGGGGGGPPGGGATGFADYLASLHKLALRTSQEARDLMHINTSFWLLPITSGPFKDTSGAGKDYAAAVRAQGKGHGLGPPHIHAALSMLKAVQKVLDDKMDPNKRDKETLAMITEFVQAVSEEHGPVVLAETILLCKATNTYKKDGTEEADQLGKLVFSVNPMPNLAMVLKDTKAEEATIQKLALFQPVLLKAAIERGLQEANGKKSNSSGPKTELERTCERNLRQLQRR